MQLRHVLVSLLLVGCAGNTKPSLKTVPYPKDGIGSIHKSIFTIDKAGDLIGLACSGEIVLGDCVSEKIVRIPRSGEISTIWQDKAEGQSRDILSLQVDARGNVYALSHIPEGFNQFLEISTSGAMKELPPRILANSDSAYHTPFVVGKTGDLYWSTGTEVYAYSQAGGTRLIAGSDEAAFEDGASSSARFNHIRALARDDDGNVLVDDDLVRIRKISKIGEVTTLAGDGERGLQDGQGTAAEFYFPDSLSAIGGDLFVTDGLDNRIREITKNGVVKTILDNPELLGSRMVSGEDGYLYILENDRVRKLGPFLNGFRGILNRIIPGFHV